MTRPIPRRPEALALALLALLAAGEAAAFSGSPPIGRANDPPDGRNCTACHGDFALNSGDVTLSLVDEITGMVRGTYEPGLAYDLRLEISSGESGRGRWGFQLVPLAGETMAGELSAGPSSQLQPGGDRTYLGHAPAISDTGGANWPFSWTAPASDVGEILFWACGNAANRDFDTDGDYIECTTFSLTTGVAPGGALTRVARWNGAAPNPAEAAFGMGTCTVPSEDLGICEETELTQESIDGPLPLQLDGTGRLVFIEHDSDTAAPGTADLIEVVKDPAAPGGLLVRLR